MEDQRLQNFFLMQSSLRPISLVAVYLLLVTKIGPYLMKNRQPLQLNHVMILYNLIQIFTNGYYVIASFPVIKTLSILCTVTDTSTSVELPYTVIVHYKYLLLKVLDFAETIIFVLRKKHNQVSFLHLFHHVGVFFMSWIAFKYSPGGQNFLSAYINVCVHTFMYIYYLVSMWTGARNRWWKKYMTGFQVLANSLILLNYIVPLLNPHCSFPKWILFINIIYMLVILYLFGKFYKDNYAKKYEKL